LALTPPSASADFVEVEQLLEAPAASLAEKLDGVKAVIAVRNGANRAEPWDIGQAAGVELSAALRRREVDAVRAAGDLRFGELEALDRPFTAQQAKSLKQAQRQVLVGIEWLPAKKPRLKITALAANASKPIWTRTLDIPDKVLSQAKNIPPWNRTVVEFARKTIGTCVREGDCTQLAEECLKAAGLEKRGIYRWGRELGPREPWLPGDILQIERTTITMPEGTRGFPHHTVVVDEVSNDAIVVLHQNAYPDGKVVQRETWPVAGIKGYVVGNRPWNWPEKAFYPPACPIRWSPALVTSAGETKSRAHADLLHVADPRLDRVQGIWFFENNGRLRSPCEFEARLQLPVAPPKSYALRMTVERLQGTEQFGIGIVAHGRQTMISIDNSDSRFTGLHNLDGKPANDNESTKPGKFLPLHKLAEVECRVTDDEIQLDIDKEKIINWQGDPARLSVSPDWPVPHGDWLFISAYNSEFEISSFSLDRLK
jgi:hypothetical protein